MDIFILQDFSILVGRLRIFTRQFSRFGDVRLVDIANGCELDPGILKKAAHDASTAASRPQNTHDYAIIGAEDSRPGAGGEHTQTGSAHPGEEMSAIHLFLAHRSYSPVRLYPILPRIL